MHKESYQQMQQCYEQYVLGTPLEHKIGVRILDVGGSTEGDGYFPIFKRLSHGSLEYLTTNLRAGSGTTHVVADPYKLPFKTAHFDIVICGQVFEHSEFFWLLFDEMVRVTRLNGLIFLIAPSTGYIHRARVDCYRFNPDAYRALAKFSSCELLNVWRHDSMPWHDLVGVFRKAQAGKANVWLWRLRRLGSRYRRRPVARSSLASELTAANLAYFERRFSDAFRLYRGISPGFAEDPVFLSSYCHAAYEAGAFEECLWAGLKLAQGFFPSEASLFQLGHAAMQLGRYDHVRREITRLRDYPGSVLTAFGWELSHHAYHGKETEGRWAACRATEAITTGFAAKPHPPWAIQIIRESLSRYGETSLLQQLEENLK